MGDVRAEEGARSDRARSGARDPLTRRSSPILVAAACAVVAACGGETGFSGPPPDDGDELRPGLTVRVGVEEEEAGLAGSLGWTAGVPGAEVRIHRLGTDFAWQTEVTDAAGVARFPGAIPGRYRVAGYRPLAAAERTQAGGGVRALGDGWEVGVSEATELPLAVRPTVEGSVVFSEVYATAPFVAEVDYDFHMYFELYNNAGETVFLDGMLFGTNAGHGTIETPVRSCADTERLRNDPEGIWVKFLHRFPGSGSEYPLAPGETVVVALDAVDHSEVDPRFPDLSGADFELLGSGDVDNPDVPNLPEVGTRPFPLGHGLWFFVSQVFFLTEPVDLDGLPRDRLPASRSDQDLVRIPREAVVDVLWTENDDALEEQQYERCYPLVHRSFDRLGGGFVKHGADLELSVQRLVIGEEGGRKILQDTNVSAVDLIRARYTPGSLPP